MHFYVLLHGGRPLLYTFPYAEHWGAQLPCMFCIFGAPGGPHLFISCRPSFFFGFSVLLFSMDFYVHLQTCGGLSYGFLRLRSPRGKSLVHFCEPLTYRAAYSMHLLQLRSPCLFSFICTRFAPLGRNLLCIFCRRAEPEE